MLWFAFNLLSLTYWKQLSSSGGIAAYSCDLLSIYYLWHTENNMQPFFCWIWAVVICFQSIIFDILKTTTLYHTPDTFPLWFAFNLLSLTYWKQHERQIVMHRYCCDLLSIYYLWHTENNLLQMNSERYIVVICFQSIIFDILKTTMLVIDELSSLLWFAFNLLSLTYWKQHNWWDRVSAICCDLLSIYYLWHTENNTGATISSIDTVVICFQSIIFDILKTTQSVSSQRRRCCDLLSIYYLWHTENNVFRPL